VVAPVSVTDRSRAPVVGLEKNDFLTLVDGKRTSFDMDEAVAPLSMVIATETGTLGAAALAKVRKVGSLIQPVLTGENGDAAIVSFGHEIKVVRNFGDPLTPRDALDGLKTGDDGSAILDAVVTSAGLLAARPQGHRKVILLISESKDRHSKAHVADAIEALQKQNIELYSLTFSPYLTPFTAKPEDAPQAGAGIDFLAIFSELGRAAKHPTVDALSAATGGTRLSFLKQHGLEDAIQKIGLDLHSQYILSFAAPDRSPGFHKLEIQVLSHPEATVRTRPGYWITSPQ
jgi:VWFA-related protein